MENIVKPPSKPKEKRRNNEKRKEKSRDAARCRRSRETEIFTELAGALPLSKETVSQLDKASVMRLAISYLKVRNIVSILPEIKSSEDLSEADKESVFLKALDGFMMVVSEEGDIIYLSENVNEFLGITQVDLMGQNVYEYSHACDHDDIRNILTAKSVTNDRVMQSFFLRMKCTLTSKGRNVNLKSATYKVIHATGHIIHDESDNQSVKEESQSSLNNNNDSNGSMSNKKISTKYFIAVCQPIAHPSNIEVPLDKKTFLSKHSLDMKFTYADEQMLDLLGFQSEELLNKSIYDYHYALDSDIISTNFKNLFSKGQCETSQYRFLAKYGGYIWVVSQATVLYDKCHKPQSVVCVHYVVSGIERKNEIYSLSQQLAVTSLNKSNENNRIEKIFIKEDVPIEKPTTITLLEQELKEKIESDENKENNNLIKNRVIKNNLFGQQQQSSGHTKSVDNSTIDCPQTATSKIFTPRTEEMNKGFLMFSDEEPGLTILKDEPDDLTHLAPTAGDVCVPLAENNFFNDMFDELMLNDNYCPLLNDELNCSLDSSQSSVHTDTTSNGGGGGTNSIIADPFLIYRDEYDLCKSELSHSPNLLSPNLSKSSEGCSLSSLNSPSNSLSEDDQINTFMSLQMESEEETDFVNKAPFIPMNINDDLPLLNVSEDLMWGPQQMTTLPNNITSTNIKFNTKTLAQSNFISNQTTQQTQPELTSSSSLAQLLCQKIENNKTYKTHDRGGGIINMTDLLFQKYQNDNRRTTDIKNWNVDENGRLIEENKSPPEIRIKTNYFLNNKNTLSTNTTVSSAQKRSTSNIHSLDDDDIGSSISKRCRSSLVDIPKEKLSSELLNQLMSKTIPSTQAKRKAGLRNDWHLNNGGTLNSTGTVGDGYSGLDNSQMPSNSVLMNLLDNINKCQESKIMDISPPEINNQLLPNISVLLNVNNRKQQRKQKLNDNCNRQIKIRKTSFSLLDPEGTTIPSLMDLSEQDYDVNAPVNDTTLLQGCELLSALEFADLTC